MADLPELERYRPHLVAALGRPLSSDDLTPVATTHDLTPSQRSVLRVIADRSRPHALVYLRAIVPTLAIPEAFAALQTLTA